MTLFQNTEPGSEPEKALTDSLLLQLIFLLLSIILCSLVGTLLIQLISSLAGMDLATTLMTLDPESSLKERNYIRLTHLISQVSTFAIPALLVAWFFHRRQMWRYLRLAPAPPVHVIGYGILIILFSIPLTQFTYWLNQQIPLPQWMFSMENQANETIEALLVMDSPWVFLFNLTVVALLPALGEEFLFRGILQQQLEKRFGRPHLAIWVTAIIFSGFHMQFAGFLPRMLLGGLLGYLLFWTRSLWVPIAGHFAFNGIQIVGHYLFGEEILATEPEVNLGPNWFSALLSLFLVIGLSSLLQRMTSSAGEDP